MFSKNKNRHSLELLLLMVININFLSSPCYCFIFSEEGSQNSVNRSTKKLRTQNSDAVINDIYVWSGKSESSNKTCIKLSTSGIYLSMLDLKNNKTEIDFLKSINITKVDSLCNFNPKVLKISFKSGDLIGTMKYHFLIDEEDEEYELLLVDLLYKYKPSRRENETTMNTNYSSSYSAFRSIDPQAGIGFGDLSYFCSSWLGADLNTDSKLRISGLHFQVFREDQDANANEQEKFSQIGQFCAKDLELGNNTIQVDPQTLISNILNLSHSGFLLGLAILLGSCGVVCSLLFAVVKLCPKKAKRLRQVVFKV